MSSLDTLIEDLRKQIPDESAASAEYNNLAAVAYNLAFGGVSSTLRDMAADEERHRENLIRMIEELTRIREVMPKHRPFPRSYADWADLGTDIRVRDKDPVLADKINEFLTQIYEEMPGADDAKRWLVQKAGELGIT